MSGLNIRLDYDFWESEAGASFDYCCVSSESFGYTSSLLTNALFLFLLYSAPNLSIINVLLIFSLCMLMLCLIASVPPIFKALFWIIINSISAIYGLLIHKFLIDKFILILFLFNFFGFGCVLTYFIILFCMVIVRLIFSLCLSKTLKHMYGINMGIGLYEILFINYACMFREYSFKDIYTEYITYIKL